MQFVLRIRPLSRGSKLWQTQLERVCLHPDIVANDWAARCTDKDWLTLTNNIPLYNIAALDWDPGGIVFNGCHVEFNVQWLLDSERVVVTSTLDDIVAVTTNSTTVWKVSELKTLLQALCSVIVVPGLSASAHLEIRI